MSPPSLGPAFLAAAASASASSLETDALESALAAYVQAARAAWPELEIDVLDFVRYAAVRTPPGQLPPLAHAADLWLACACVLGDPASVCLADETIVAFLGRQLSDAQLQFAERHLGSCAQCRQVVADAAYAALDSTDRASGSHASGRAAPQPGATPSGFEGLAQPHDLPAPGAVISGKYRLESLVGRGGMGVLYAARHLELGQRVAIKLMQERDPRAVLRFLREARIHARLESPHIPRIYDLGRLPNGSPYIAMEFLEGEDLGRVLARGPLPVPTALDYLQQVCAALREPHAAGIVHRDLKPANLFLVANGTGGCNLKVLDFGISKYLAEDSAEPGFTATHSVLGSPLYMSPEQLADSKNVDLRTDLWSLGVIAYQLLSGQLPFSGSSLPALCMSIRHAAPPPPSALRPELPRALDAVVLQCLEKRPEDRIASVGELSSALVRATSPEAAPAPRSSSLAARRSLAVLGFEDLTAPGSESWLSAAIVQLFSAALMSQRELRLVAPERVAQARRDLRLGVLEYARPDALQQLDLALCVDLVLFGSFLRTVSVPDPRLRLQLLVKSARDGETLLSCIEEGQESNLYEMTERAAARLRERLGLELPGAGERDNAKKLLPESAVAARHYAEGLLELYRQRPARALPLLTTAAELAPEAPLVRIALARAADGAGRDEQARASAERALGLSGVLAREARLALEAQYHATLRQWPQAIAQYQALCMLYPDELDYGVQLARLQMYAGQPEAALATVERLHGLPGELGNDPRIDLEEARAAHGISDYRRCLAAAQRAAAIGAARQNWGLVGRSQYFVGLSLVHFGDVEAGLAELERGRELARASEDLVFLGYLQPVIAFQYLTRGELARARAELESAAAAVAEVGNDYTAANISESLARIDREQGQHERARARVRDVLPHYRLDGSVHALSTAFTHLASLDAEAGELDLAEQHVAQALDYSRQLGRKQAEADALCLQAALARRRGQLARAESLEAPALELALATGNGRRRAQVLEARAERLWLQGDAAVARAELEQALGLRRAEHDWLGERLTQSQLWRWQAFEQPLEAAARAAELRAELERAGALALAARFRAVEILARAFAAQGRDALELAPSAEASDARALGLDGSLELRAALASAALAVALDPPARDAAEAELASLIEAARQAGLEERAAWIAAGWQRLGGALQPAALARQLERGRTLGLEPTGSSSPVRLR